MHIVDLMSKRLMVRVTALVRMTRALTLVALLGGSVAGCPDGGVNITTPANPCGTGTRLVKGACLLLFDGVYIGPFSGTKTIVGFNGSTNVSATLNLTVTNGSLIRAAFDGVPFAENVGVTNSGPGISNTLTWPVGVPNPDPRAPCSFHMTGTFRSGTALGNTASGSWSYDNGSGCSGGGTWQANAP